MATNPKDTPESPIRILLVDDSEDDYILTRDILGDLDEASYTLEWTSDEHNAVDAICRGDHDIYLIDYRLGRLTGIEVLRLARERECHAPMILLTGLSELAVDLEAMRAGASDYLEKDKLDAAQLERAIRYNLQQTRHEEQLERKVQERTAELAQANAALQAEIAERVRAEAALREADERKNLFLATLGHELRNPLVPIRNALEIMRMAADRPDVVNRSRGMIERQVGQLVRLVDDLVDLSRITRGNIQLRRERIPIEQAVGMALESSRPFLDSTGQALDVQLPDASFRIDVDPTRFGQILMNLLNNAAKYGRQGGRVSLIVHCETDGRWLVVKVADDGIGIPPELLERVFDVFVQLDRPADQTREGLGIGLSLVRTLAALHGGTVEARSDGPGRGSEFTVRLPVIVDP